MLTHPKILKKLEAILKCYMDLRFEKMAPVPMALAQTREHFRAEPGRKAGLTWRKVGQGAKWGGSWITGWFRGDVRLPKACDGREVFLRARTGGAEGLLLVDGDEAGVFDANHGEVLMTPRGRAGRKYHVAVEAYSGHTFPGTAPYDAPRVVGRRSRTFEGVDVVLEREDVTGFVFDLAVLCQLVEVTDENSLRRHEVAVALGEVFAAIDADPAVRAEDSWRPKLEVARAIMKPLLATRNGPTAPRIGLIAHAHLDTAWLWPVAETWRKCARTFSSMLNLMGRYPEVTFVQSAPCHTDAVRREYPNLYKRIRRMVAAGRWEPNGAMWIEPDCNIPSGESFVRQLLVGQTTTREMFGYTADTLWLPDVFGYSAALPQILRGCDVPFFCTTKMTWNDTTRLPYDTFVWKGIDGTSVISHFNSIHCWPDPKTLTSQWNWVQHKDSQDRRLCAYGFGDGGGGPMAEMMEVARRVGDLEGCPRTGYTTVSAFMESIRDEMPNLPVWSGELYLELHRGTLTAIAAVKRLNRKSEFALRDAELLATLAGLAGAKYPAERLLELWKQLLTNQFHDILPGSSIAEVNDEAVETFGAVIAGAGEVSRVALSRLFGDPPAEPRHVAIVNSLSWDRVGELVLSGIPRGMHPADATVAAQAFKDVTGESKLAIDGVTVPAMGSVVLALEPGRPTGQSPFVVRGETVRTPHGKVRFDKAGRIVSFVDRATGRQLVRPGGRLNRFWLGENIPANWDNWDIDADQELKMASAGRLVRRRVVSDGPLQLRLRCEYELGEGSALVQDVVFHAGSPRVDFETVLHWSQKRKLLRVGFELDILADSARHEIQYGHLERPTHRNRPQDRARFEVCAHKWTDVSENGFGAAVLNDCKYGVSVLGSDVRLTLLTSGVHPDARADAGRHVVTYSLLPHACGFSAESVIRPAYELNSPPIAFPCRGPNKTPPRLVSVDSPNIIIESVKWAQRGKAMVIRLYEAGKTATQARLRFHVGVSSVTRTNLLEERPRKVSVRNGRVRLRLKAFEIVTLRCEL